MHCDIYMIEQICIVHTAVFYTQLVNQLNPVFQTGKEKMIYSILTVFSVQAFLYCVQKML